MPQVQRWFLGLWNGRLNCTFGWTAINNSSVVLVSASESARVGSSDDPNRFVGNALITVHNIAPFGIALAKVSDVTQVDSRAGVRFVVTVDWSEPLPIWVDTVLLNEEPQGYAI